MSYHGYRHIVCATDLSEESRAGAQRARELSECYGARLTLLHVVDHFAVDRSNQLIAPEDVDPKVYHEQQARRSLAALAEELQCHDAERLVLFAEGSAGGEIARFARAQRVDLIVLTAHPHRGAAAAGLVAEFDVLWVRGV